MPSAAPPNWEVCPLGSVMGRPGTRKSRPEPKSPPDGVTDLVSGHIAGSAVHGRRDPRSDQFLGICDATNHEVRVTLGLEASHGVGRRTQRHVDVRVSQSRQGRRPWPVDREAVRRCRHVPIGADRHDAAIGHKDDPVVHGRGLEAVDQASDTEPDDGRADRVADHPRSASRPDRLAATRGHDRSPRPRDPGRARAPGSGRRVMAAG